MNNFTDSSKIKVSDLIKLKVSVKKKVSIEKGVRFIYSLTPDCV